MHFSRCLNVSRDGEEVMSLMCECKSFHIHAPATVRALRPTIESLTAGTIGGRGQKSLTRFDVRLCDGINSWKV